MQCGELERYLEAFLDGRLGRSRSAVLRRHLAGCLACRSRVDRLKQFERDLARHVRALERLDPVWTSLDLDLVKSAQAALPSATAPMRLLPPPNPAPVPVASAGATRPPAPAQRPSRPVRRRRLASQIAGTVLIAAAAGTALELSTGWLSGASSRGGDFITGYLSYLRGDRAVDFGTADASSLQNWFATQFGQAFPLPPEPPGFVIVGGRLGEIGGERAAVVVYAKDQASALLFVKPRSHPAPSGPEAGKGDADPNDSLTHVSWHAQAYDFALVSTLPPSELGGFAPAEGGG